ncbi:MAG: caspase family protein [Bacteroidetes bacterium]|nr:caspase family protein [Bacteroidota bacterium]
MKRQLFFFLFLLQLGINAQLKDVKIIIPKEIQYSYYDLMQFLPGEKFFVVAANALSVYNTETCEVIDEYELSYGVKNLSISPDGKYIVCAISNELLVFSFDNQKIQLLFKVPTADLIKGQPNAEYYGAMPIGGCFFTGKPDELYVSVSAYTMLYNLADKKIVSSFAFPITDYVLHAVHYVKTNEAVLAKITGTVSAIIRQSLTDLAKTTTVLVNHQSMAKINIRDSLLFGFAVDKYFILDLLHEKVVHEVRLPRYDYTMYGYDKSTLASVNKRISLTKPDTVNFAADEYVYDIDYLAASGTAVYATSRGLKFIDLKTKKLTEYYKGIATNLKFSGNGNRLLCNSYTTYRALRVYDPKGMKLISERIAMGNPITSADISPGNKWLYTNSSTSGFFWDLRNLTKYAELKDISGNDSAYIQNVFFLSDSEVVVNSGKYKSLNLSIYNLNRKKYKKVIKKGVFSLASGFINNEFYYCDYTSLHIINLKTLAEEKYTGQFSLAASPLYQIINFTKNLVFIPEANKYKVVNRKTKKVEYESETWSVNARVMISDDDKYLYTFSQIKKKKTINGYETEIPTNALVKIDMVKKEIVRDYAETYFPYDFKIKNNGKNMGVWYVKNDMTNYVDKQAVYTEYDLESGAELFTKPLATTKDMMSYHYTSESGKYFALLDPMGKFFKVYNINGDELIDLSESKFTIPKCFFIESASKLIVTSSVNSLATFVDLEKKQVMGQLANANDDNFFLITKDLHYLGSKEFIKNIRFKYQSEIYSFDQFDAYLNQPHEVLKAFGCSDTTLIKAYQTAYLKRMKVLGLKPDAKLNFSLLPTIQTVVMKETKPGFLSFSIGANKGQSKLVKLTVYNNGTLVYNEAVKAEQQSRLDLQLPFETSSGINRFEFVVKDEMGIESPHITRFYNNIDLVKPDLYLVVIASEKFKNNNFDLAYALKDANDVANTMVNSKSFKSVQVKKLFNQSFAPDSVKNLNTFFAKAGINDVVMIFFAGHGYLDSDLSYYFPTYYTDFSDPKINSVAYKSFEKLFNGMKPIRKLMFIDACFSGEVDEDVLIEEDKKNGEGKDTTRAIRVAGTMFAQSTALEMSKTVFSDLRQNSGATIISSAGGTEAAFEGEKWNNGLFTHCLLKGLKSLKADNNADSKIMLSELQKYVSEEVYKLSEGKQMPTYRMENLILDYELW